MTDGQDDDVKEYYDEFAKKVFVRDFEVRNRRHDAVRMLCDEFIPAGCRILEIGCGPGINTHFLQRHGSEVLALDIGENNIAIASEYANKPNTSFKMLDITRQADEIRSHGPFDAVLLADVIEHIPLDKHAELFANIESVLSPAGRVVLSYPAPETNEYLLANHPEIMQVVDERVELPLLLSRTQLKPIYFSYCDVHARNEYVHLVLSADRSYDPVPPGRAFSERLGFLVRRAQWRVANRSFVSRLRKNFADNS